MALLVSEWSPVKKFVWYFALATVLSTSALSGQDGPAGPSQAEQLATAIARAKSGNVDVVDVETIAEGRAVQAIPSLEEQFETYNRCRHKDQDRQWFGQAGETSTTFIGTTCWSRQRSRWTARCPTHCSPTRLAKTRDQISSELQAWAQAHHISASDAAEAAVYGLPGKVFNLAQTGDPRGIPLLRRALQSRNFLIAGWAATGLVLLQDKDSIPLIIAACQRAPSNFASGIA